MSLIFILSEQIIEKKKKLKWKIRQAGQCAVKFHLVDWTLGAQTPVFTLVRGSQTLGLDKRMSITQLTPSLLCITPFLLWASDRGRRFKKCVVCIGKEKHLERRASEKTCLVFVLTETIFKWLFMWWVRFQLTLDFYTLDNMK